MNEKEANTRRIIFDYIGHHPEYGQHPNVCHICGNNCDITGKFIFEGNQGAVWEGEHFEFPICTYCFYEELSNAIQFKAIELTPPPKAAHILAVSRSSYPIT